LAALVGLVAFAQADDLPLPRPDPGDHPPRALTKEEQEAVDDIRGNGGNALKDREGNVTWVTVGGPAFPEAALAGLQDLRHVGYLDLCDMELTDVGLAYLRGLPRVKVLRMSHAKVTAKGLKYVGALKTLGELELSGSSVDDAGLAQLAGLVNLTDLNLGGCPVGDAGMRHLRL
jgi:hypothetical protein